MTQEDALSKAVKDIMLKEPFYGFFLIMLNKLWSSKIPTAGVSKNGINYQLTINPLFFLGLTEKHRRGVIQHELLHIVFHHIPLFSKYGDHRMYNLAADIEINQFIEKGFLPCDEMSVDDYKNQYGVLYGKLKADLENGVLTQEQYDEEYYKIPPRGVHIEDFPGLNLEAKKGTKYYYDKLKQAQQQFNATGSSGDANFDEMLKNDMEDAPDHSTWKEFDDLSDSEKELIDKQLHTVLKEVAEQTVKKQGTIPGNVQEWLDMMDKIVPPKFNWKAYLRRFVGNSVKVFTKQTRRKENRKFPDIAALKVKEKQNILLAIDVSGSVSTSELEEFMSEIYHIHKTGVDITVIQCDTNIRSIESYKKSTEISIKGRGGTSFDPVLEYFNANKNRFNSLIYFTDGECNTDIKPLGKVLWVHSERSTINDSLPGFKIKLEL